MFPFYVVLQFGLYFYVYQIRKIPVVYKDAAGIWWEDRFRPYVCMVANVVLNVVLVQIIGISGIILSTVFSLLISIPWENYTIFKYVFHCSSKPYYGKMAYSMLSMLLAGIATYFLCKLFDNTLPLFFVRLLLCIIMPNILFFLMNFWRKELKDTLFFIKRILRREF